MTFARLRPFGRLITHRRAAVANFIGAASIQSGLMSSQLIAFGIGLFIAQLALLGLIWRQENRRLNRPSEVRPRYHVFDMLRGMDKAGLERRLAQAERHTPKGSAFSLNSRNSSFKWKRLSATWPIQGCFSNSSRKRSAFMSPTGIDYCGNWTPSRRRGPDRRAVSQAAHVRTRFCEQAGTAASFSWLHPY
jgi:hypothetical protein